MIQIELQFCPNQKVANEELRRFQVEHPRRQILSVSLSPNEPIGYFMTITYNLEGI